MAFDWLAITIGGEKTLGQSLQPAAKNTGVHFFPLTYPPSTHMYTQYNKVPFKKNGRVQCWRYSGKHSCLPKDGRIGKETAVIFQSNDQILLHRNYKHSPF